MAIIGRRMVIGSLAVGLMSLAGCGSDGTVTVENGGRSAVTVALGEIDFGKVDPAGGAAVNTDDCLEGPIVVTFESGRVLELTERACPGQRLLVRDESAEVIAQRYE